MTIPAYLTACEHFGLTVPLFQAPTGSIAGPELAAAVSSAGAMGALALTWTDPETARAHVSAVRRATPNPFLVNFALAFPPASLPAALDAGAPIVSFSWGDPTPHITMVARAGARVGVQVTGAAGARRAVEMGADFVICQGVEAGGHVQSSAPLIDILASVICAAKGLPVIAAGGISDAVGIANVLRLGASGAMLGTRFVATRESRAHEDYKQQIVRAKRDDTALTVCFEGGWPNATHRVLRNDTLVTWEAFGCPPVGNRPGEGDVVGRSQTGEAIMRYEDTAPRVGMTGRIEDMCLYAGQGVDGITDVPAAGELVHRLWRDASQSLSGD